MKFTVIKKGKLIILLISLILGLSMFGLYVLNAFNFWDWKVTDFFFYIRPEKQANSNIVIVAIDDESIARFGKFPWPTNIHAKLLSNISAQKPKVISFDILFDKSDNNPKNDLLFAKAIKKAGNVILSMGFTAQTRKTNYFKKESEFALDMAHARLPIEELRPDSGVALDIGATNIFPEKDAINRKIFLSIPFGDKQYLTFASATAMYAMNLTRRDLKIPAEGESQIFYFGPNRIQLDRDGCAIINYYNLGVFNVIPYAEIYDNKMPEGYFKDKIVLIGGTAAGLGDLYPTPIWHALPGVEIQATVLSNILDNNFLKKDSSNKNLIIIIIFSLLLGVTTSLLSPFKNAAFAFILSVGFLVYSYLNFANKYTILPAATVLITIIFLFIILNILRLFFEEKEKDEITQEKDKYYEMATVDGLTQLYVARYFRQRLKEEIEKAQKENTTLSFVMIDIDNFKKVNDIYGHEQGNIVLRETAQIVKNTLRSQTDIAARYGGEEIALILPNTTSEIAFQVANRIRERMASHTYSGFKGFKQITASFGVANFPQHAQDEKEIVERADEALYVSKKTGKNKVTMAVKKEEGGPAQEVRTEDMPKPQEAPQEAPQAETPPAETPAEEKPRE